MPVQTAIRLQGHVFSRITKMRRSNAMRHCAPKFSTMLIDNRLFSSRDYRNLLTLCRKKRLLMPKWIRSDATVVLPTAVEEILISAKANPTLVLAPISNPTVTGTSSNRTRLTATNLADNNYRLF
jgi:hypothetical protein